MQQGKVDTGAGEAEEGWRSGRIGGPHVGLLAVAALAMLGIAIAPTPVARIMLLAFFAACPLYSAWWALTAGRATRRDGVEPFERKGAAKPGPKRTSGGRTT